MAFVWLPFGSRIVVSVKTNAETETKIEGVRYLAVSVSRRLSRFKPHSQTKVSNNCGQIIS